MRQNRWSLLRRFPWIAQTIGEYESRGSNKAKFVWAVGKILPLLTRKLEQGRYYIENGITKQRFDDSLVDHRRKAHAHPKISSYYEQLREIFETHQERLLERLVMTKPKVAVIVDGPDPDNYVCILAALSSLMCYEVVAVIMTGRPVSASAGALPYVLNPYASRAVRRDNALHAKGILMRHGGERILVFEGGRAPFSTIPHDKHIHERVTDVYDDAHAGHMPAGDIDDAVSFLAGLDGPIHVICGGPMTDLAYLMRQPMLEGKLGIVTAQLGMFNLGTVKTIAGGRRQFNVLADVGAAYDVLTHLSSPFYLVPTDITKHDDHAFHSVDELGILSRSKAFDEVTMMYDLAWPHMWGKLGIPAHVHDFHPAELMDLLLREDPMHHVRPSQVGRDVIGRYSISPVGIKHVPHLLFEKHRWGEIDLGLANPQLPSRFLVDGCDTSGHRRILAATLNAVGSSQLQMT
ncbi:MAG TPA: hypothetical protein VLI05_04585 [Candidatus Saccharimonadia bacterium]|nr:hypothetical protein [Candidatus Saccharimonadia bacterium]